MRPYIFEVYDSEPLSAGALEIVHSYNWQTSTSKGSLSNATMPYHIDGLVQERRNSSALAMELRLSYTTPLIFSRYTMCLSDHYRTSSKLHDNTYRGSVNQYASIHYTSVKRSGTSVVAHEHINAGIEWPPFCRWHFYIQFLVWKLLKLFSFLFKFPWNSFP